MKRVTSHGRGHPEHADKLTRADIKQSSRLDNQNFSLEHENLSCRYYFYQLCNVFRVRAAVNHPRVRCRNNHRKNKSNTNAFAIRIGGGSKRESRTEAYYGSQMRPCALTTCCSLRAVIVVLRVRNYVHHITSTKFITG